MILAVGVAANLGCHTSAPRSVAGLEARGAQPPDVAAQECDPATEAWIRGWFSAWELVGTEVMGLPRGPAPVVVLFDERCVWTTSEVTGVGTPTIPGPTLFGETLPWRAKQHGGVLSLPDGQQLPVALLSFTSSSEGAPFFVMASPGFWKRAGVSSEVIEHEAFVTGVFLHEFSHARHVNSFTAELDRIEETWAFPEAFTSDVIQARFADDPEYVAAYEAELEALHAAIDAHVVSRERPRLRSNPRTWMGDLPRSNRNVTRSG